MLGILRLVGCEEKSSSQFESQFQAAQSQYDSEQYQDAFTEFKALAEKGYAPAEIKVIEMLLDGKGVRRNEALAVERLKQAAEKGNVAAQVRLGDAYFSGELSRLPQEYHLALKWFTPAAEKKNPQAQQRLGEMHQHGWGVRQNKQTAKEWFGKACDNGSQAGCNEYRELGEQGY